MLQVGLLGEGSVQQIAHVVANSEIKERARHARIKKPQIEKEKPLADLARKVDLLVKHQMLSHLLDDLESDLTPTSV